LKLEASSIRTRLLLLMIGMALVIASAVSAVHLNGLIGTWLNSVHERMVLTAQQVTLALTQRLNQPSRPIELEEAKRQWANSVRNDRDLEVLLERTMAQSNSLVEISISDDRGVVLTSSNPTSAGKPRLEREPFESLLAMNPVRRFGKTLFRRNDYQYRVPLGVAGQAKPVFEINVLVSSVLLRDSLMPHVKGIATVSGLAMLAAVALSLLAANIALSPLKQVDQALDEIAKGTPAPARHPGTSTREFAVVQSKLNLLGEQFRGAQQLIEKLEEAILLFDQDENLILAGEPAHRLLGLSRSDLRGKTLRDLFPPSTELGGALRNAMHLQLPFEHRAFNLERNGHNPLRLLVNIELLPGANSSEKSGALVSLRDAEGRKQVQSQLDLSERLTAIGRLTGGVAHEIKNPLNSIALRLEVLRAQVSDAVPEASGEIDIIASEVTRLDRVVKTFLDFTKPVSLNLSDVDLVALAGELVRFVSPEAQQANVQINFVHEPGSFYMRADRDLLKQAMLNVLMNGVEAMGESGGSMRVKVERSFVSSSGGQCIVSFSDSGPGIAAENRGQIFQLYFSTKKKGSGIGLAMAFRVVQLHGGRIEFTSEQGKGTTFLFLLPLVDLGGGTAS
jgi:PAS domain S-box-containing protein